MIAGLLACGGHGGATSAEGGTSPGSAGKVEAEVVARARVVAPPGAALDSRADVLSMAQAVEALAVREGVGARAQGLHALAATVLERVFRRFGRDQDGKEATLLFQHASTDLKLDGACASATRAALLSGEVAHDAAVTYTELYRVRRRVVGMEAQAPDGGKGVPAPPDPCADGLQRELASLAAFRPPLRVLEAIDQGLEGEGMLGTSKPSASHDSVSAEPRLLRIEPIAGAERRASSSSCRRRPTFAQAMSRFRGWVRRARTSTSRVSACRARPKSIR